MLGLHPQSRVPVPQVPPRCGRSDLASTSPRTKVESCPEAAAFGAFLLLAAKRFRFAGF